MEAISRDALELNETVIKGGFCIGCGACAAVAGSPFKIQMDEYSKAQAVLSDRHQENDPSPGVLEVCPFSDRSKNEDEIAKPIFSDHGTYHEQIGYNMANYAGFVKEGDFRSKGSSGGMGSWIAYKLLQENLVDGVIHVHQRSPTGEDSRLFQFQLSKTIEEVRIAAKSRYYPIELSEILKLIQDTPGRYAVIGIPCFIKAIRLVAQQDEIIRERVKFCVGLICGHLKSGRFAEMLGWEMGIRPSELSAIDFRNKIEGSGANKYGVRVTGELDGKKVERISPPVNTMYGTNWGFGFFKYRACEFCDDVVAETADVTVGDAWLPQYVNDSNGTNVVIVRNPVIQNILQRALSTGDVVLDSISADEVASSQKSGFEHRRTGLAYRLFITDLQNVWRPRKRVQPENIADRKYQKKQILRMAMAERSHIAFNNAIKEDSFQIFKAQMDPLVNSYQKLYAPSLYQRIFRKARRVIKGLLVKS